MALKLRLRRSAESITRRSSGPRRKSRLPNTLIGSASNNATIPLAALHDRSSPYGWERDTRLLPKFGDEPEHRCFIRWLAATGGGKLIAEGDHVMFFQFELRSRRHAVHRRLWERGIHALRYQRRILAVHLPAVDNGCEECEGVEYVE